MVTDAFIHDKDTPKWIDYIFCDKFIFFHLAWLLCLFPGAAIRSCSLKEVLLKISSKTQRETPVMMVTVTFARLAFCLQASCLWCNTPKVFIWLFSQDFLEGMSFRCSLHCTKKWNFPLKIFSVNVTNPRFPADLVTFTEEILNAKIHFFCSALPIQLRLIWISLTSLYKIWWIWKKNLNWKK